MVGFNTSFRFFDSFPKKKKSWQKYDEQPKTKTGYAWSKGDNTGRRDPPIGPTMGTKWGFLLGDRAMASHSLEQALLTQGTSACNQLVILCRHGGFFSSHSTLSTALPLTATVPGRSWICGHEHPACGPRLGGSSAGQWEFFSCECLRRSLLPGSGRWTLRSGGRCVSSAVVWLIWTNLISVLL